jgi:biopolymer transport protein ExbD
MRIDAPARKPVNISLTPLIDVVFILLVFFMLATRFIELGQQPLSVAVAGEHQLADDDVLLVRVLGSDQVELNGKPLALETLATTLASKPTSPVFVSSGDLASLQDVLKVTDLLQQAGMRDVHLELLP